MAVTNFQMYLCLTSLFQLTVGELTITTTPAVIEEEISKSLSVTCRFHTQPSSEIHAYSIAIKKLSANSTFVQLASISFDTNQTPHIDAPSYGISGINGLIDSTHGSFLTVDWLDPKVSESGTYQCKVNALKFNLLDRLFLYTENNTVSFNHISISSVFHRLRELEAKMNNSNKVFESTLFKKSTVFNGHQYYLSLYEPHSAANAEMACNALGGYLAEVDSKNEMDFLITLIGIPVAKKISFLLGGTDEHHEGNWINRHSGSPLKYNSWFQGQPDNFIYNGLTENCQTLMYNATEKAFGMNDLTCFNSNRELYTMYFICEIAI